MIQDLTLFLYYVALGQKAASRQTAYQELFRQPLAMAELSTIHSRMNRSGVLGSDRFQEEIARVLGLLGADR